MKYYTAPYGGTPEGNVVICQYETILEAEEAKAVLLELGYLNKEYIKKLEK